MTGPALLITIVGFALATIFSSQGWSWPGYLGRLGGWLLGLVVLVIAARPLGGRAGYTRTLRAVGFASMARFLALLAVIPVLQPLAILLTVVVTFFATWIGAVEAQKLRGWRGLVLPVVVMIVSHHRCDCDSGAVRRRRDHASDVGGRAGPGAVRTSVRRLPWRYHTETRRTLRFPQNSVLSVSPWFYIPWFQPESACVAGADVDRVGG